METKMNRKLERAREKVNRQIEATEKYIDEYRQQIVDYASRKESRPEDWAGTILTLATMMEVEAAKLSNLREQARMLEYIGEE